MANVEVGSAYVSVYPKSDKKFNDNVGKSIGDNVGGGLTAKSVMLGNIMSSALTKAATAAAEGIASVIGGAMENFANYEQLVGGVETLFKDSAGIVEAYAENAYQTAGLSANEYMETVTSFSASLLQSLDGDTAAAAKYADMAITDMSDNANKMGSSMESIQNAYQGFAKQNYTMLDNLKLGYGGTKSEMERLLADAEKISGVKYDISSYSDIVDAIHVVQTEMGITGTTAEEASQTISGSVNAMKGAWDNWLTSLATQDMDLDATTEALIDSIATVAQNVVPRLGLVVTSIIQALPGLAAKVAEAIPEAGAMVVDAVVDFMSGAFGIDIDAKGLIDNVSSAFEQVRAVIENVTNAIGSLVSAVWPHIQSIIANVSNIIGTVVPAVWDGIVFPIIQTVMSAVQAIIETVWPYVSGIIEGAVAAIDAAISGLSGLVGGVVSTFQAIGEAISGPIETARGIIDSAIDTISSIINGLHLELPHFSLPHFVIDGGEVPWGIGGMGKAPTIDVQWYASGAVFTKPTVLAGVGEGGEPEGVFPLSYLDTLLEGPGGGDTNIYIDGARVNDDEDIRNAFYGFMTLLSRKAAMNRG